MDDHLNRLDLCPDCDGLRVMRLDRIMDVVDVRIHAPQTGLKFKGRATVYMGPVAGPCPNVGARKE